MDDNDDDDDNNNVKTAVYTNVNGDIVTYTSKTAKIKKVILLSNTSLNINVAE